MIYGLTKDDIAGLPAEQQETLAQIALDEAQHRRTLVMQAKGYPGHRWASVMLIVAFFFGLWFVPPESLSEPFFYIVALIGLIQFHTIRINRRIDAVLKLMELNLEEQARRQGDAASHSAESIGDSPAGETRPR